MYFTVGCTEGEVRLAGGANYTEGRVEICLNNQWGTICSSNWNNSESVVVCKQLKLSSTGKYKRLYLMTFKTYFLWIFWIFFYIHLYTTLLKEKKRKRKSRTATNRKQQLAIICTSWVIVIK